jgi:leucyl-tRNA synthetase
MTDAGVLRLYSFYYWVQEMKAMKERLRAPTSPETFADKAFSNEMNRLIMLTAKHYEATNFKEAVKTGFFEYQVLLIVSVRNIYCSLIWI